MAANGGMNLAVGLELSQFDKDFQKLTSKVESIGSQLGKYLDLVPTVNTKAFEASVQKMDKLWKQHIKAFEDQNFELKVGVRGVNASNKQAIVDTRSFKFDDLFGSIDKAENSIKQLKSFLRNPSGFEGNFGQIKEIVQYQEAIIRNWKTATGEVHKQDAAVKTAIAREAQLQQQRQNALRKIEAESQLKRRSLEEDRANAKLLSKRIDQIHAEQRAVNGLLKEYENLAKKQRQYGADDSAANQRIAKLKQEKVELQNLEGEERARIKALNQNNSLFNDQGKLLGKLRTLASRYISIFTIGTLARKVAEITGFFERQQVALEGIVGSATKAAEIMGQIKSFAPNSPFQTKQLIEYTKQLAAYNIAVDDLFPKTKMLADLSAGLGVDMQRLILAYGQVNAASVLRGQELRQFTEAGIPMVQKLADKFSELNGRIVTTGEVFELISKRQVSFDMVSQVLTDMTSAGGKFYNMQANLMGTVYGQIEKLKDLWTLSLDAIGKSSHKTITRILSWMQAAVKNATSLLRGLTVTIALNTIGSIYNRIKELRKEVGLLGVAAKGAWGAITIGAGVAFAVFKKLWDENHRINKQFEEIHKSFDKQTRNAIKGLDELKDKLHEADKGTKSYQEALDALSSNYSQYIGDVNTFVQSLSDEADAFGSLEIAIKKYNEALEKKQQLEQTRTTMGESFEMGGWTNDLKVFATPGNEHWNGIYGGFKDRYEMSYDDANAAFEEVMSNIFTEMRDKNLLSVSDDRKVRNEENEKVFRELLPTFMKKGGLEKVFADFSQVGIDNLWSAFNSEAFLDNDSRRAYSEYRRLRREQLGEGSSDFAWISRIENTFDGLPNKLKTELQAATPEQYSREYNAKWIEAALGYIGNEKGDFAQLGRKDENGNLIEQYAKAEYDALISIMERETKRDKDGNLISFDEASIYNVENAFEEYRKALAKVDKESAGVLSHLMKIFSDGTDEASGRAAAVRETIFKIWANDAEGMKIARQYLPKDSDFSDIRGELPQKQMDVLTKLGEYGITLDPNVPVKKYKERDRSTHSAEANADIDNLLKEYEVVTRLMEATQKGITISVQGPDGKPLEAQLFDISSREKNFTGGGGHDHEFPDFYNILKNAYELYKKALQQGGVKNGINEVRTNAKIQEVYGGLFGGEGGTDFDSKIGNKTLGEILVGSGREHLIKGGLEDGIVNFREAGQALADELEAYGKTHKETHGSYIRMAEQIRKWVDETFTKDEIQKWLESFERSVQNLTIDFENMHNNIDLGRAMIANGTIGSFADITGIARPDLTRPQSQEQRENIGQLIAKYNEWAKETVGENGEKAPVFELGDMKNIKDVRDQIAYLNEQMEMNKGAFKALPQGEILTKALITALKDLDKTMRTEIAGINGRQFTGNGLNDAIANSLIDRNSAINSLVQKMRAEILHEGSVGTGDYKQFAESVKKGVDDVFKNFEKQLGKSLKRYPNGTVYDIAPYDIEAVKKKYDAAKGKLNLSPTMQGEMDQMWFQLEKQMKEFNASIGTGMIGYMRDFFHPEKEAARRYDKLKDELDSLTGRNRDLYDMGYESLSEKQQKEFADNEARIKVIIETKTEMGENGENIIPEIRNKGYENMMKDLGDWQGKLDKTKAAADALFGTIKSMTSALSKFYDMMNDGENPEWMQDMDGYMEDFMGDFEALVAPIVAVMGLIKALTVAVAVLGTTAGAVFGALIAAAAIAAAIFAVFQMHDRRLERQIEKLKDEVEELDAAMQHLQSIANRTVGFEKLRNEMAATGKELEKAALYEEMANKEKDKKNTDDDKVREYERSQQEALDAFEEGVRQMRDTLVKSTDDWASQMGSAIRQAFQNGENAARAFRDTVKTMMGDVIEKMLQMAIIEPLMESILQEWTNSDYLKQKYTKTWVDENGITRKSFDQDNYLKEAIELITDHDRANKAYDAMVAVSDMVIDTINELPTFWKDAYMHNSELGTLSGGIESVTEDTARRIEALENSQLGEIFAIRTILEQYLSNSGGFGDSTMASVQAAVVSIASDTSVICRIMQSFENQLNELRTSPARPLHVTMA